MKYCHSHIWKNALTLLCKSAALKTPPLVWVKLARCLGTPRTHNTLCLWITSCELWQWGLFPAIKKKLKVRLAQNHWIMFCALRFGENRLTHYFFAAYSICILPPVLFVWSTVENLPEFPALSSEFCVFRVCLAAGAICTRAQAAASIFMAVSDYPLFFLSAVEVRQYWTPDLSWHLLNTVIPFDTYCSPKTQFSKAFGYLSIACMECT